MILPNSSSSLVDCQPHGIVFDLLKEKYGNAVERLGTLGTTRFDIVSASAPQLVQYLMAIWNGKSPLEEAFEFPERSLGIPDEALQEEISARLNNPREQG